MRILIIEDDRDAAAYLVKAFREAGHIVDHAADGVVGYDLALEGGYDVAIVDRMLPKMDGLSLIGALARAEERDAGADPVRARPGRRPRQGPSRRRRRLSRQALCVFRTAGARRGARPAPPERRAGRDGLPARRSRARSALAQGDARGRGDRPAAARISSARISACRTRARWSRAPCCSNMSGTIISIRRPMSSTSMSRGCAPRSTGTSTRRLLHTVRGAGYMIRDGAR